MVEEAPAKALQAQPGTFISVATTMLSTALAPFAAPNPAPAAPAPSPGLLAVLAWVRREIEATYQDVSISIGGVSLVQRGTAMATSEGFGSLAIAWGANSTATATGLFSMAIVDGDDGREFVTLRIPYPLGFYSKGFDGRIDDPDAGWKGRGLWVSSGDRTPSPLC